MRTNALLLVSVVLSTVSLFCCSQSLAKQFEPVLDQQYYPTLMKLIDGANKRIGLVQLCLFSERGMGRKVTRSLCKAVKRGVKVDVVLEGHKKLIGPRNHLSAKILKRAGVKVSFSTDNKVVHTKLVLVDYDQVLFGSTNLSNNSMKNNHESNLLLHSQKANRMLWRYLRRLKSSPHKDVNLSCTIEDGDTSIFTDRLFVEKAIKLINSAKKTLQVSTYFFARRNGPQGTPTTRLYSALAKAAQRGVRVEVYLEKSGFAQYLNDFTEESVRWLRAQGPIFIRLDSPEKISHCKLIIADSKDPKSCSLILGSTNWSRGDVEVNHQVNCLVNNPKIVQSFSAYFAKLYEKAAKKRG